MYRLLITCLLLGLTIPAAHAQSGEVDVVDVRVEKTAADTYRFHVTIASNDTGWDAYADAFEVVSMDGEVLGKRTLHHPHVDEQPFTRSLSGVRVPPGEQAVIVRGHHNVAGYDGLTQTVGLPD